MTLAGQFGMFYAEPRGVAAGGVRADDTEQSSGRDDRDAENGSEEEYGDEEHCCDRRHGQIPPPAVAPRTRLRSLGRESRESSGSGRVHQRTGPPVNGRYRRLRGNASVTVRGRTVTRVG